MAWAAARHCRCHQAATHGPLPFGSGHGNCRGGGWKCPAAVGQPKQNCGPWRRRGRSSGRKRFGGSAPAGVSEGQVVDVAAAETDIVKLAVAEPSKRGPGAALEVPVAQPVWKELCNRDDPAHGKSGMFDSRCKCNRGHDQIPLLSGFHRQHQSRSRPRLAQMPNRHCRFARKSWVELGAASVLAVARACPPGFGPGTVTGRSFRNRRPGQSGGSGSGRTGLPTLLPPCEFAAVGRSWRDLNRRFGGVGWGSLVTDFAEFFETSGNVHVSSLLSS